MTQIIGTKFRVNAEEFVMTTQIAVPTRYLHERYFGRPSCPRCGELMMAPEYPQFTVCRSGDEIRHFWACDACDHRFNTLVKFEPLAA